ncbi:MAG: DUF2339 domain-containing protein [Desulfobacteraceae bacterium]|nr:DUF2339 domain-containing protein [Desulfobacteraceae bacterium]
MHPGVLSFLLIVVPAVWGGLEHDASGFLLGGSIGLALAGLLGMRRRLASVERELAELKERLSGHPAAASAEGAAGPAAEKPLHAAVPEAGEEPLEFEPEPEPAVLHLTAAIPPPVPFPGLEEETDRKPPVAGGEAPPAGRPRAVDFFLRFATGGNLLVKTGLLVLFIGVAFLVKYASERHLLPIELRLAGAALGGIALVVVGWRLREKREHYALTLQGGGIGILYLVVFGAFRIYDLVPSGLAFAILLGLCALSACLAILQDSPSLAIFAAAGGFLAPLLTSTGKGSHVILFSYYALLDAGILGIAWFKAWRLLNLTGFAFTFGLGTFWGCGYYTPEHFASTEPFLVLFFLFFMFIAVLFALRQQPRLKGYLDGTIVFGTPIVVFGQQAAMVQPYDFGAALSAIGMGAFYVGAAWAVFRWRPREMRLLSEAFLAIGIGFGTIAIPLAFDFRGIASAWALEGAALVWVGVRQERLLARLTGMLLQLLAGIALLPYFLEFAPRGSGLPILNGFFMGSVLVAAAGLFSSLYLTRNAQRLRAGEAAISPFIGYWGLAWWYGAGWNEIDRFSGNSFRMGSMELFVSISCIACGFFRKRLDWALLRIPALGMLPAMFVMLCFTSGHPAGAGGFIGWPVAFASLYRILHENDEFAGKLSEFLHASAVWCLFLLLLWEVDWQAGDWTGYRGAWREFASGACFSALLLLLAAKGPKLAWPVAAHLRGYLWLGLLPVACVGWVWTLAVGLFDSGDPWPLAYLPIANPLDVGVGFVFLALIHWLWRLPSLPSVVPESCLPLLPGAVSGVAGAIFLWLNAILVRSFHHWGGVPYTASGVMASVPVQASLSIFWTVSSLCLMVFAARGKRRTLWFTGAALLAATVVKLFVVDLSSSGTIGRIVSFVGVGILILIVGYLSPVPPQDKTTRSAE